MLYIKSVLFYMVIIFAITYIAYEKIKENGWVDGAKKSGRNWFVLLICMSVIPLFRLLIVAMLFVMACITKEEFDKWKEEYKDDLE